MTTKQIKALNDTLYRLSHMKKLAAAFGGRIQSGDQTYTLAELIEMEDRVKHELSALRSPGDHLKFVNGKGKKK